MRRLFWLALGASAGVLAFRRASQLAQQVTPAGLAGSAGGAARSLTASARDFAAVVREGMAERESELRSAMGLDETPALAPAITAETSGPRP